MATWLRTARQTEFWLLWAALLLASLILSSLNQLGDRLEQRLESQVSEFIAADLVVRSDQPLATSYVQHAAELSLQQAQSQELTSMASQAERTQLVQLKAVSSTYPLRGQLQLADTNSRSLQPGEIWLDNRLWQLWQAKIGDQVELGDSQFRIAGRVLSAPDQSFNFTSFMPFVMVRLEDLAATGLVTLGSRVNYRLMLAGTAEPLQQFRDWSLQQNQRGVRLEGVGSRQPLMQKNLARAQQVFSLAGLLGVVLATCVLALASRTYLQHQQQAAALMRCLGASQNQLLWRLGRNLLLVIVLAVLPGTWLGIGLAQWLSLQLAGLLPADLPHIRFQAGLKTALVLLILLIGSIAPWLWRLAGTPPWLVLRDTNQPSSIQYYYGSLLALLVVLFIQNGLNLTSLVFIGLLILSLVLIYLGYLLLRSIPIRARFPAVALALNRIRSFKSLFLLQSAGLMLVLLCLMVLDKITQDLQFDWQQQAQQQRPNSFLLNLQPGQEPLLQGIFSQLNLSPAKLLPLYRARLSQINNRSIDATSYPDEQSQRLADREFNISLKTELPVDNHITAGDWQQPGFSVEQGLAQTLGIKLGDQLEFNLAGQAIRAKVSSLRQLHWDSMRLNFFVLASPELLPSAGFSQVASFYLTETLSGAFDRQLQQQLPQASRIDIGQLLKRVGQLLQQLSTALSGLLSFALIAGWLLVLAALSASQHERRQELALLRTLGATWPLLRNSMWVEVSLLSQLSVVTAWLASEVLVWYLGRDLQLAYQINLRTLLITSLLLLPSLALAQGLALKLLQQQSIRQLQS